MLITVVCVIALIAFFVVKYAIKCYQLPAGPIGLPFIGYYPFLGENPGETIAKLSKKYGDIMTINILGDNYWFLNSIEAIEEAFVKNGELFAGRPHSDQFNLFSMLSSNLIGVIEGNEWKTNRRITFSNLSLLGMGKSDFEPRIHELLDKVEEHVDSKQGMANDYFDIVTNFASNIITTLVVSKQYEYNDPEDINIRNWSHNIFATLDYYMNFHFTGFGVKLLTKLRPKYAENIVRNGTELRKYVDLLMEERMKTFDANDCKDLLDYFLKEKDGPNRHLFHWKAISAKIMELIFAGTDVPSVFIYNSLRVMSLNPKVQKKVHKEISDIFGTDGVISFADRYRLPYTQAVISEIHRFLCLVQFITTHVNREATKLWGFEVPKRQKIIANCYAISRNPKYFANPDEFDPNNFLDTNGAYLPNKALFQYSIGIRKCPGVLLSEIETFLLFTRLMQRFEWRQSDCETDETVAVSECLSLNMICAIRRG